jgi:hypothetical protein
MQPWMAHHSGLYLGEDSHVALCDVYAQELEIRILVVEKYERH